MIRHCLLPLLFSTAIHGQTLVATDFEDGTTQGWKNDYAASANPSLSVMEGEAGGHYLQVGSGQAFRGVYHFLPERVTLGVGQSLSLSFKVMFTSNPNVGGAFRFGFFYYGDGDTADSSSDKGYFASVPVGGSATGGLSFSRDGVGTSNDPTSGSDTASPGTSTTTGTLTNAANVWHEASFTLTLVSATELKITASFNGVETSVTSTSTLYTEFGMIYLGSGNTNPRFAIDDVVVTYPASIPEPGAFALLAGLGILSCSIFRHRPGFRPSPSRASRD